MFIEKWYYYFYVKLHLPRAKKATKATRADEVIPAYICLKMQGEKALSPKRYFA